MVLRISPSVSMKEGENEILILDKRRRQVTLLEQPLTKADSPGQENRPSVGVSAPKMFAFDQVYAKDEPQVNIVFIHILHYWKITLSNLLRFKP